MTILETERLILRDYRKSDLRDLHRLLSDKKTMYFLDELATNTLEETKSNLETAIANADGHYFCICGKATGSFTGSMGYTVTAATPLGKVAHLGYFLLPEHHRQGYAPEAAKRVLEFAFTQDNCVRITTACYRENDPSRKVMERAGLRKEGERIRAQYHGGAMKDRLEYALNKDEWEAMHCI